VRTLPLRRRYRFNTDNSKNKRIGSGGLQHFALSAKQFGAPVSGPLRKENSFANKNDYPG
jgi:hypothetical protein